MHGFMLKVICNGELSMYQRLCGLFLLFGLIFGACARGDTEIRPAEIHYGQDACTECNMIISDPRFAASYAYELSEGRYATIAFDDIGDMLMHAQKHPEHKIAGWYVHDYQSKEWLDATQAFYVFAAEIRSPMGHGIAAHTTREAAQSMATTMNGEVLTWSALKAR